jgi:type I restriction enzyme S subunit
MNKVILSSIIDIISGGTPKTSESDYWNNGDIGWLSVTDFNNDERYVYSTEKKITEKGLKESNTKLLQYGDIIISARGTVGALAQIGLPMCFNQSCFGIRGKVDKVDNDFLYFALKNYVQHIKKRSQGSVFDTINLKSFNLMEIEIPKIIAEQQKIAKILSDLDTKIELNNKINDNLELMAKTLYDYWFVQFDFPDANGKPYKTSGGKMVWNSDLKREIPDGWEVGTLDSIGDIIGGSTPSKAIDENFCFGEGTPWITPKDLSNNKGKKYITRGEFDVTELGLKEASLKIMPSGTVLLSSRAPIGYLAIARNNVTTNQGFKSLVPKNGFSSEYIYYAIQNHIPEIEANSSGSTFKEVSTSTLRTIKTIIPTNEILLAFDVLIKPTFKKQNCLELESQELATLRDWLLPMLMNGQLKVE